MNWRARTVLANKRSENYLAIVITSHIITFKSKRQTFYYPAHEIFAQNLFIGNPTKFIKIIKSFMHENNLTRPKTVLSVDGKGLEEKVGMEPLLRPGYIWHTIALSHQKNKPFYYCGINQALIFQYSLYAFHCNIDLAVVTSCISAQIAAYKNPVLAQDIIALRAELQNVDKGESTLEIARLLLL